MTKDQAVKFFGTQVKLAEALGIKSQGSVAAWDDYPPPLRQLQIEALTKGELKAEPDCDKFRFPPAISTTPADPAAQVSV